MQQRVHTNHRHRAQEPAPRRGRSRNHGGSTSAATQAVRPSYAVSDIASSPNRASLESGGPYDDVTDDDHAPLQSGGGSGSGSGSGGGSAAATLSATFNVTGNGAYTDTASQSTKPVKFNAKFTGGTKTDYIIVNWFKGSIKDKDGKYFKAKLYGSDADINAADWQVDSVDADPAYWSDTTGRWNYNSEGADGFSATDNPGQLKATQKGSVAKVDFRTAVYKAADVPTTTTGSLAATALTGYSYWEYHTTVKNDGTFEHPA